MDAYGLVNTLEPKNRRELARLRAPRSHQTCNWLACPRSRWAFPPDLSGPRPPSEELGGPTDPGDACLQHPKPGQRLPGPEAPYLPLEAREQQGETRTRLPIPFPESATLAGGPAKIAVPGMAPQGHKKKKRGGRLSRLTRLKSNPSTLRRARSA